MDAVEEPRGIIIGYSEDGEPVSVEFMHASRRQLIRAGEINVTLQAPMGMEQVYAAART